jgi:hypothetical protein
MIFAHICKVEKLHFSVQWERRRKNYGYSGSGVHFLLFVLFFTFFLMSMLKEFKEFAMKGNVVDLAV